MYARTPYSRLDGRPRAMLLDWWAITMDDMAVSSSVRLAWRSLEPPSGSVYGFPAHPMAHTTTGRVARKQGPDGIDPRPALTCLNAASVLSLLLQIPTPMAPLIALLSPCQLGSHPERRLDSARTLFARGGSNLEWLPMYRQFVDRLIRSALLEL